MIRVTKWTPPSQSQPIRYYLNKIEGYPENAKIWIQADPNGTITIRAVSGSPCPKLEDVLSTLLTHEKITQDELANPAIDIFERLSMDKPIKWTSQNRSVATVAPKLVDTIAPIELTKPVSIVIDHREPQEIFNAFNAIKGVSIDKQALASGDFVFQGGIIERKTAHDLTQSIIDRRLFFQSDEMASTSGQVLRAVILEGDPYSVGRISPNAIDGAISYLAVLQGLTVLNSRSVQHTANLTARMASHAIHGLGYEITYRQAKPKTTEDQILFVIQGLPGIGVESAKVLLRHFGSLAAVFKATPKEIQQVDGFGKKTSESIINLINEVWRE